MMGVTEPGAGALGEPGRGHTSKSPKSRQGSFLYGSISAGKWAREDSIVQVPVELMDGATE